MTAAADSRFATTRRWLRVVLLVGLVLLGVSAPRFVVTNGYLLDVARLSFYLAALAGTWSLLAGVAGQFSFAHVAIAGMAGYAGAVWSRQLATTSPALGSAWVGIAVGALFAVLVGLLLAALLGRLRGAYLALFTIAFAEIAHTVVIAEADLTGGTVGMVVPQLPGSDLVHYYVMLAVLAAELAAVYWFLRSRTGLLLQAMREDSDAAAAMGVHVQRLKLGVFVLTSLLIGVAGAVYSDTVPRIGPDSVDLLLMTQVLAFAIIGGLESPLAAALAAVALTLFLENTRSLDFGGGALLTIASVGLVSVLAVLGWSAVAWRARPRGVGHRLLPWAGWLAAAVALLTWFLFAPRIVGGVGSRAGWLLIAAALVALVAGAKRRAGVGLSRRLERTLTPLALAALAVPVGVRLLTLASFHADLGVWRYAFFGAVLVVTLRFAPNGLLTPLLQALRGREAAVREAAAGRSANTLIRPELEVER